MIVSWACATDWGHHGKERIPPWVGVAAMVVVAIGAFLVVLGVGLYFKGTIDSVVCYSLMVPGFILMMVEICALSRQGTLQRAYAKKSLNDVRIRVEKNIPDEGCCITPFEMRAVALASASPPVRELMR